jgi:ABC-type Mn2+/Zn2+ transport system permease subunit
MILPLEAGALLLAIATGVAAGLVGCFAVMRRMTLASDAISHIALPGIGVALLLHTQPLLGGVVALVLGVVLVWALEQRTRLSTETVIGVVFSTSLAAGSLLLSGDELLGALFGGSGGVSAVETVIGLLVAAVVVGFVLRERHRLVLLLISPEIARTSGINVARLDLRFLIVFALTIGLGLRYLGVLLIGSLAIIPAATAKRLAQSLNGMLAVAVAISVLSTVAGTLVAHQLHRDTGPMVILIASGCFLLSLLSRRTA